MKKNIILVAISLVFLSACAQKADKIQAAYVSPLQYEDFSCTQIKGEINRVGRRMNEVAGVQDKTASGDAVAMGVGLVLFWPALFFINTSDQRVELGRLKGEFDALEQVAIKKNCSVAKQIQSVREERQREVEKMNEVAKPKAVNE